MIHNQIERYDYLLGKLSNFIDEIRGNPVPTDKVVEKAPDKPMPSLSDVLGGAPTVLENQNARLDDLIQELRSLLF